jgi:hypothetical protein
MRGPSQNDEVRLATASPCRRGDRTRRMEPQGCERPTFAEATSWQA